MASNGPDVAEDFENIVNGGYLVLILLATGLVVYILYEVYEGAQSLQTTLCGTSFVCNITPGCTNCPSLNPFSSDSSDDSDSSDNADDADVSLEGGG